MNDERERPNTLRHLAYSNTRSMTSLVPHSTLDQPDFDVRSRINVFKDSK